MGHAQTFGNAVDVVEVGDDLCCARDGFVVEPVLPKVLDVGRPDRGRILGQLLGVLQQRRCRLVETRGPPVGCETIDEVLIFGCDLIPEVV